MKRVMRGAVAALFLVPAVPVSADALDDAGAAYMTAWEAAPLSVRKALFVSAPADGFGVYSERADGAFAAGEPILIYVEPVGYGFTAEDGMNSFGTAIDVRILTAEDEEIFAQTDFLTIASESAEKPTEFFGNLSLEMSGLPAGAYVLELTLKDMASDETAPVTLPFEVE